MIAQHLPILQIVLPLMAAPVCMVIRHPQVVWIWATLITFLCLPISIALLVQVMAEGVIVYDWVEHRLGIQKFLCNTNRTCIAT